MIIYYVIMHNFNKSTYSKLPYNLKYVMDLVSECFDIRLLLFVHEYNLKNVDKNITTKIPTINI